MYPEDIHLLRCPTGGGPLILADGATLDDDGEIISGSLTPDGGGALYPIRNGIPRFVDDDPNRDTWNFKWTEIDKGQGLNYRIADKSDQAYTTHDLFDRNSYDNRAHACARGGVALDLGCGIGQYAWRLAEEFSPEKLVALDLTEGVDLFRAIMLDRFPHLKRKLLMVQASVFQMPFADQTFDYVMSLGVLMHTGDTRSAIRQAARVTKLGGHLNFWIYASEPVPYEALEPGRAWRVRLPLAYLPTFVIYTIVAAWVGLFRLLPHGLGYAIVKAFSSALWWRLTKLPLLGYLFKLIFPTVDHPDRDYRLINNYDGYVNSYQDTWSEHEIWPLLRDCGITPVAFSDWRLGVWGAKRPDLITELSGRED